MPPEYRSFAKSGTYFHKDVKLAQRYALGTQRIGDFAEYLVACDLVGQGYRVHMASPGSFYDLILDDNGRLYRVQVKSTLKPKRFNTYKYNINVKSKHSHFDIAAYVAADVKAVCYEVAPSVNTRKISITRFESMTIEKALADLSDATMRRIGLLESPDETL